jgi:hypothetical protein
VAEAMAPLGDNFVRVFTFIGATQSWVFYDPLIPDESTLKHLESGEVYWILVNEPARLTINGERLELTCADGNDNCSNSVTWP